MGIQIPVDAGCDNSDWRNTSSRWVDNNAIATDADLAASEPLVTSHKYDALTQDTSSNTDSSSTSSESTSQPPQPFDWASCARTAAYIGVFVCIAIYSIAQVLYLSPVIQEWFVIVSAPWFGVLITQSPDGVLIYAGGHAEMLRPMFFVVWAVAPLLTSLVLYELARSSDRSTSATITSSQRMASRLAMRTGALLRRKPVVWGYHSPFSNGELLFQFALVGGNVGLFAFGWAYTRQFYPAAGERYTFDTTLHVSGIVLGYSCVFNMSFLLLPSTRNCAWMDIAGISYANGIKYHRWLGVATLLTGVGHAVPFYWWWQRLGTLWQNSMPCFDCSLDYLSQGYTTWFNVFGELSLVALLIVGVTSIPIVRRRFFETFYYTHHLYIAGVVLAVMHWVTIIWWLLPTLVVYLISRSVSTWNALHAVRVLELTALPDDIVKIVIARASDSDGGSFAIGQFVYLNVPVLSKLQWHAFTIASAPTTTTDSFTLLIKALGDWTRDLVVLANDTTTAEAAALPTMLVDGYYGASLADYTTFQTVCLIGGGIGATPLFAILEDFVLQLSTGGTTSVPVKRLHFVFSFREVCLLQELHPVLTALRAVDPLSERVTFHFYLTREPSDATVQQRIQTLVPSQTAASTGQPFTEPLRSRTSRIVVYVFMLVANTLLVLWLEVDGGRLLQHGTQTQWWPLEQFIESATLFVLPAFVFLALAIESRYKQRQAAAAAKATATERCSLLSCADGSQQQRQSYSSIDSAGLEETDASSSWRSTRDNSVASTDVVSVSDLLSDYNVTIGARPDMQALLTHIHREFVGSRGPSSRDATTTSPFVETERIGVFISGPEALKTTTERVVAAIDARSFDIHAEEFEL